MIAWRDVVDRLGECQVTDASPNGHIGLEGCLLQGHTWLLCATDSARVLPGADRQRLAFFPECQYLAPYLRELPEYSFSS